MTAIRVAVVAEFYPRAGDPVLGVWAHRQSLAVRDAGADVRVVVLHRPVPPRASVKAGPREAAGDLAAALRQPLRERRDGLSVAYVPYVSPPRPRSYHAWGAWAAPGLALALRRLRRSFGFDLVHAHNAIPAGDAVRRARLDVPTVVSIHGGDVLYTARQGAAAAASVRRALASTHLALANSAGIARLALEAGAREARVVHLGTDIPDQIPPRHDRPTLVTLGHLVARKRHSDVLRALALLAPRHPDLRYVVIGDGPEREPIAALARELGVSDRLDMRGQLEPARALDEARRCWVAAMPALDEAFGLAYVETMAAGVPAIGCHGEPGPEEIAAAGPGLVRVAPGDFHGLAREIDALVSAPERLRELGEQARQTVARSFTWKACGEATLRAYEDVLR